MEFEKNLTFKFDQAENIATVGQVSYIEEAKNIKTHPFAILYTGVIIFLKLNSRLIFNQNYIYCNTHGSFVIAIQ
jgi:hypothetical protein